MTPRSLFTIVIKIFGMYLTFSTLTVIPYGITTILRYKTLWEGDTTSTLIAILFTVVVLLVYLFILYGCLYKTDWIINKLALAEHFAEERFEINIHRSTVLRIAVIIIGALTFMEALPIFCRYLFNYLKESSIYPIGLDPDAGWMIYYFIEMFIGFFLMTSSRPVVNFIEMQRKKNPDTTAEEEQQPSNV